MPAAPLRFPGHAAERDRRRHPRGGAHLEAGLLTPPFGLLVYTVKAATKDEDPSVSMVELFASSTPYWIIILLCMAMIIAVPAIATALPAMLF